VRAPRKVSRPGKEHLAWVTNTVTLIYGQREAVLVDTFLSDQQSKELLDWVFESGRNLTTIYVTHAHGDHFFGLKLLLDKFPNAKAIATTRSQRPFETRSSRSISNLSENRVFQASSRSRNPHRRGGAEPGAKRRSVGHSENLCLESPIGDQETPRL
jgi:ribonuclease BN (tRNA processing enzyme)